MMFLCLQELPRVFHNNYGHSLDDVINIQLGGGFGAKFKYCSQSKKIHGLIRFIGKYCIKDDYVLFFNYLGNSTFEVSVYDCQHMNHFRDIVGYLRFEDFMNPPYDTEVVDVSSGSEDNITGNFHSECYFHYCFKLYSLFVLHFKFLS